MNKFSILHIFYSPNMPGVRAQFGCRKNAEKIAEVIAYQFRFPVAIQHDQEPIERSEAEKEAAINLVNRAWAWYDNHSEFVGYN